MLLQRRAEADEFYAAVQQRHRRSRHPAGAAPGASPACCGRKQFYYLDIPEWLDGDPLQPPPPESRLHGRNADWRHLNNADIISVPDKWEYPWYAAWDLAFHCVTLAAIDPGLRQGPACCC